MHSGAAHRASPLPAARVLEASGREGLPRGRPLRQGGHQHPRQRVPSGEVRTVLKVMGGTLICVLGTRRCSSPPVCDAPLLFLCRHGWNLTVLPNNTGSILRHLGAVPGKPDVAAVFVVFERERAGWRAEGEPDRGSIPRPPTHPEIVPHPPRRPEVVLRPLPPGSCRAGFTPRDQMGQVTVHSRNFGL